jgi:hypothetical protein
MRQPQEFGFSSCLKQSQFRTTTGFLLPTHLEEYIFSESIVHWETVRNTAKSDKV